jgi:MFS transporter, CP family, cyanate transporter
MQPQVSPVMRPALPVSPWPAVWLYYLVGVVAAAQLGKLAALAPWIVPDLALPLPTMALAISLLEIGGATMGSWAGRWTHRVGLRRSLQAGVAALALAGFGGAWVEGAAGLLAWRLLEAAGYLAVIVSAPVLLAQHALRAGVRAQGLALTLWSTFVPVGMALGAWASAGGAALGGWRSVLAGGGVLSLILLGLVMWTVRYEPVHDPAHEPVNEPTHEAADGSAPAPALDAAKPMAVDTGFARARTASASRAKALLTPAAWTLALGFGAFALFEVGVLALLPTVLVQQAGLSAAAAGQCAAAATAAAVLGSALGAILLRHGVPPREPMAVALAVPALLLYGVFTAAPSPAAAVGLAVALNLLGGVYASLAFALLPRVAVGSARLVAANGLLAQCGASGSLLGPPLMAWCVQAAGWPAAAVLGTACVAVAVPLSWHAARSAPRSAAAGPPAAG